MKKVIAILISVVSVMLILLSFAACGSSEPFQCDYCGKTVEDGKKYETVDSYGDTWSACEDCYKELKEMQQAFS